MDDTPHEVEHQSGDTQQFEEYVPPEEIGLLGTRYGPASASHRAASQLRDDTQCSNENGKTNCNIDEEVSVDHCAMHPALVVQDGIVEVEIPILRGGLAPYSEKDLIKPLLPDGVPAPTLGPK